MLPQYLVLVRSSSPRVVSPMSSDLLAYTFSALVAGGGVLGFVKAGSIPSLLSGLAFGTGLAWAANCVSRNPRHVGPLLGKVSFACLFL